MSSLRPKPHRLRLDAEAYEKLRLQVLQRDGWRCQHCGKAEHLEVHHQESRGQHGDDAENNLIVLCSNCHSKAHGTLNNASH